MKELPACYLQVHMKKIYFDWERDSWKRDYFFHFQNKIQKSDLPLLVTTQSNIYVTDI